MGVERGDLVGGGQGGRSLQPPIGVIQPAGVVQLAGRNHGLAAGRIHHRRQPPAGGLQLFRHIVRRAQDFIKRLLGELHFRPIQIAPAGLQQGAALPFLRHQRAQMLENRAMARPEFGFAPIHHLKVVARFGQRRFAFRGHWPHPAGFVLPRVGVFPTIVGGGGAQEQIVRLHLPKLQLPATIPLQVARSGVTQGGVLMRRPPQNLLGAKRQLRPARRGADAQSRQLLAHQHAVEQPAQRQHIRRHIHLAGGGEQVPVEHQRLLRFGVPIDVARLKIVVVALQDGVQSRKDLARVRQDGERRALVQAVLLDQQIVQADPPRQRHDKELVRPILLPVGDFRDQLKAAGAVLGHSVGGEPPQRIHFFKKAIFVDGFAQQLERPHRFVRHAFHPEDFRRLSAAQEPQFGKAVFLTAKRALPAVHCCLLRSAHCRRMCRPVQCLPHKSLPRRC